MEDLAKYKYVDVMKNVDITLGMKWTLYWWRVERFVRRLESFGRRAGY